ncbi:MAG: hypothetical protein R3C59_10365 [Planctomycetaceae bacterium]
MLAGDDFFGKVDHVPGQFFVATRFLHYLWIPIVPRESYVIRDDISRSMIRIPLRWKSVFLAWLRTFLLTLTVTMLFAGIAFFRMESRSGQTNPRTIAVACWVSCAVMAGLCLFSYRFSCAGRKRMEELRRFLNSVDAAAFRDGPEPEPESEPQAPSAPSITQIAQEITHDVLHTTRAAAEAVQNEVSMVLLMTVVTTVGGMTACVALALSIMAQYVAVRLPGQAQILSVVTTLVIAAGGSLMVRWCGRRLLKHPLYFGESREFWIVIVCLSWILGAFLSLC